MKKPDEEHIKDLLEEYLPNYGFQLDYFSDKLLMNDIGKGNEIYVDNLYGAINKIKKYWVKIHETNKNNIANNTKIYLDINSSTNALIHGDYHLDLISGSKIILEHAVDSLKLPFEEDKIIDKTK